MEKDLPLTRIARFEYGSAPDEKALNKRTEQNNARGYIVFNKKPKRRKKPYNVLRIRNFFIKHPKFKKSLEFGCHPSGIHYLRAAVFYSDVGCGICKIYVEKNLF